MVLLPKYMLTTPNHLLFLHMFGSDFHDYLVHHPPRDQVEDNQPVVLYILLLALREDTMMFALSQTPQSVKDNQERPSQ